MELVELDVVADVDGVARLEDDPGGEIRRDPAQGEEHDHGDDEPDRDERLDRGAEEDQCDPEPGEEDHVAHDAGDQDRGSVSDPVHLLAECDDPSAGEDRCDPRDQQGRRGEGQVPRRDRGRREPVAD
ncbi:hypothetical protein [Herbiconiux sp.]|uniref:hypothetical protein n=1 Tax=Herbiconiux sp. TaxID=1871186 RepID=UPI0025C6F76B|nr:hypothetical protein [Herbiconiux sp.]